MYGTTQKVHIARDPITVSVIATGPRSAQVTIGQEQPVALQSPNLREVIGLLLADRGIADGTTVYYRAWRNPKDLGASANSFLNAAKAFVAQHGRAKANTLLKEARLPL